MAARSVAPQLGFDITDLLNIVSTATQAAQTKIDAINQDGQNISIGDMFDMQMFMNKLSQLSEMSTSVVNATHTSISSMARNVKG
jgi:hypothetical protein